MCSEFTASNSIGSHSETTVIKADVGHIKIDLSVTYDNNAYIPVLPVEGQWSTIEKLLRQLTKDYGEEYYQMLLDYLTLTYVKPMQFLPIIMLVSKERGTGKTSFLNLLKYIYGNNAVIGGNDLIMSKFNSLLAGKLIVGVDESCLGDNKDVGESLKYMSTSKTMHIEKKGKDKKEVPAFCKFVLCSNEVKKGVFIAKDEIRFWVMRLSPWDESEYDRDFDDKIEEEIQGFLFSLKQRWERNEMFVKEKEHRMWFAPSRLENEDLKTMMAGTGSNFEGSLFTYMEEMFKDTGKLKLCFDVAYIYENVPDARKKDHNYIHNVLKEMHGVRQLDSAKQSMPIRITRDMLRQDPTLKQDEGEIVWSKKKQCRAYEFDAKYFLSPSDYDKLQEKRNPSVAAENSQQHTNTSQVINFDSSSVEDDTTEDIF